MYRLLIVDDEEIIVNGLYEIFSVMKDLDLDVYKAYSGMEALEWLNRARIDIILTDIQMPELDGLQLLEEIYKFWPRCRVIFLTGHSKFEYVLKAIRHNAISYVLKTEDPEKVVQAVENAIQEIQREIKTEDLIQQAKEQVNMALELFQKDYFLHLLHENAPSRLEKAEFDQLCIPMHIDWPVILLLGHVDNIQADLSYMDRVQHFYSIKLIISQYLSTHTVSVAVMNENYQFIFFIQPKEMHKAEQTSIGVEQVHYDKTITFLKGALEAIQTACRESLNALVSFTLSGEPCKWEAVSDKYYSLEQLLNYRIGSGIEMLLIDNEFQNNISKLFSVPQIPELSLGTESLEALLRNRRLDSLELFLESGKKELFFELLTILIEHLKVIRSKNSSIAIEAYSKVSLVLLSYINRRKITDKIAFFIGQNKLLEIGRFESWQEAADYLYNLSNILFMLQSEERQKRADNAINYLQTYIEEHLAEDLSLVRLAEQVYLNPSYLSRLYKQVTGMNLSEFIENARFEKAKVLLGKEKLRINEVARLVGYETAASFTRFFKKAAGVTPQEYRNSLIG